MKKIIERLDGLFCWEETGKNGTTQSLPFEKGSDQYNSLIAEGCKVELITQPEKDDYKAQKERSSILKELANLDVAAYKLERAISGDEKAISDVKSAEEKKALLRARL